MDYIDLHVHSNASDGTLSPQEVVELAVKSGIRAMALTDHDTLDGIPEAEATARDYQFQGHPIQIIPGVELSIVYQKRDIHILGLFVDPKNQILTAALHNAKQNRDQRNDKMAEKLRAAGIDISVEQIRAVEGDAVLTRAHFAKYLVEHGYSKNNQDAFNCYLNNDSPYYVSKDYLSPKEAISLIHQAGGIAVLAHPLLYKYSLDEVELLVSNLAGLDLDGIEAIYTTNSGFDEGRMRHLANKYNLVITGGSDFHGSNKPDIHLGTGRGNLKVPYTVLTDIKSRHNISLIDS